MIEPIERATLEAWPAAHRLTRFGWEHCASTGRSLRANAVWPLEWDASVALSDAIAAAESWCGEQGVTPLFKLSEGAVAPPELAPALRELGYAPRNETLVMTRRIGAAPPLGEVDLRLKPPEEFWRPMRENAPSEEDFQERRGIVERIRPPHVFALAHLDGAPAAIGLGVATRPFVGLYLMRTAPAARRRGLARDLVRALLDWGAETGARTAYLHVEKVNEGAAALYEHEGFSTLYRYAYWRREPSSL
jgi:GNAT superfamily N-acetyltransferase